MPASRSTRANGLLWQFSCAIAAIVIGTGQVVAEDVAMSLQLEVFVNGRPTGFVAAFELSEDGAISSTQGELETLGFVLPVEYTSTSVRLDSFEGLRYAYDPGRQVLEIETPDVHLRPVEIGPAPITPVSAPDRSMVGAVINYGLAGALYDGSSRHDGTFGSYLEQSFQSLNLDARIFGPYGILSSSGFVGNGLDSEEPAVRLDTYWTLSDDESLTSYRLGDFVSSGPMWSRPVRLGGGQIFRNFGLRPDLVTTPLPTFSGSAAVPSTVDVYIDNVKAYSKEWSGGPFAISNLPTVTGAGTARVVVRDASGRETQQQSVFYASPHLLRPGLFDYSLEIGLPRTAYGIESNDYDPQPAAVANLRYGIFDSVTIEAHGEASADVVVAGAGANINVYERAILSAGSSISEADDANGVLLYGSFETRLGRAVISATSQRTIGTYRDLASAVGRDNRSNIGGLGNFDQRQYDPPKILDTVSLSFDLPEFDGSMNISYIRRATESDDSQILSANYSRDLFGFASFSAGAFYDVLSSDTGMFATVSFSLGENGHVNTGFERHGGNYGVVTSYSKMADSEPGSTGWRVTSNESETPYRAAGVTYNGSAARAEVTVEQSGDAVRSRAYVEGAIVATSEGMFWTNRVTDGFAVLDVGAPDVDVFLENRKVATTNESGVALVPNLVSYQRSKISIDTAGLPVDMSSPEVETYVTTAEQSGVAVKLRTSYSASSAVVILKDAAGRDIPAGSSGTLVNTGTTFVVGYDGQTYIDGLGHHNELEIQLLDGACRTAFDYEHRSGEQSIVEAPPCL